MTGQSIDQLIEKNGDDKQAARKMDSQIDDLKNLILSMGGCVEKSLEYAIQALIQRNPEGFAKVHEIEDRINEDHVRVDTACMTFLAKQGPVARDLRLIISIIKINADLERMGDQSVNIAHTGKDYLTREPITQHLPEIQRMSELARKMVKESLDSFVREDEKLAREILLMDDEVDGLKRKVFQDQIAYIKSHPQNVDAALDLILVARNLERLGDHATNIAEDVIFVSTGKDVRHGGKYS
ncbi:MAG: phosphate transport system regulatory protein PhoU [Bdellovibrio sp. CG10_big_fil_rev_8_21_14_0_10_47_8]|nr:MAG: phosphate transport system regulatory protein PhoU [Bdellovibrio sp. CG10_big_fil_rev_8_21_14_0_10_47_8]